MRKVLLGLGAAVALLGATACGARSHADPTRRAAGTVPASALTRAAPSAPTTLTVGPASVGGPVPGGFLGLSLDLTSLERYAGDDPGKLDTPFVHLVQAISGGAPPLLRVGGDSTDWSWWQIGHQPPPPGIRYTLTPRWMSVAHALAQTLHGKLILGINLEADSTRLASAEADAMVSRIGAPLISALEIGNEPELYGSFPWYKDASGHHVYGRPPSYDESDFYADFARIARVMPGSVRVAGPDSGGPHWLPTLGTFLAQEPRVGLAAIHAYPLKHCTHSKVITPVDLLAPSSSAGFAQLVSPFIAAAHAHGRPVRIDEMNGISCGGVKGVSDTYTSTLWVLNTLFELLRAGVDGVNVHTVPGTLQEVLGATELHGRWSVTVHPEYYGLMMFAQAAPAGARVLRLTWKPPAGVDAWATRATDGRVRIVLINDRTVSAQTLRVRAPAAGPASVERLRAPGWGATSGVTLGGQSFGAATTTGMLQGTSTLSTLRPVAGQLVVRLPPASAALLTLPPTAAGSAVAP
ncbi:MAG: hypothetical protein JOZ07_18365 [Solirubrobacterales bacterium]|nr:hypothetical protein [Solirubrobacterales bacterium]